jgi:hypothetical protein
MSTVKKLNTISISLDPRHGLQILEGDFIEYFHQFEPRVKTLERRLVSANDLELRALRLSLKPKPIRR